jgi:hypothetical protein
MAFNYQNPYFNNFQPPYQAQHQIYKMLPISSIEEANNIPVDFNGTPTYFHNQTTNEIYIKQFDVKTGLASIQQFKRIDSLPQKPETSSELKTIQDRLDGLYKLLTPSPDEEDKPKANKKGA